MLGYKYIAQCEQFAYGTHVLHKVIPVFVVLFFMLLIVPYILIYLSSTLLCMFADN